MIQKKDFIEMEFTAKTKDEGIIFDTTDKKTAEENGLFDKRAKYGPIIICVGQSQVLSGLDKELVGKEVGKDYKITLEPEDAFGKKSAQLIQLIPARKFKDNDIAPQPGLQVNIDNSIGIIKSVSGGRILVDFNHPLSSKEIEYNIKIIKKIDDDKTKLENYMKVTLGIPVESTIKEGKATVEMPAELPKEIAEDFAKKIKEVIPSLKDIEFKKKEEKKETGRKC
jgi:FKBP-type peptidyl-prolyl cis-trans isomerase SlyD